MEEKIGKQEGGALHRQQDTEGSFLILFSGVTGICLHTKNPISYRILGRVKLRPHFNLTWGNRLIPDTLLDRVQRGRELKDSVVCFFFFIRPSVRPYQQWQQVRQVLSDQPHPPGSAGGDP